jgi:prepilin-type N-terminal cleavage/methylation domain-containing protein
VIKKNNKGFTLVELLVVVAIMGILSTVVVEVVPDAITKAKLASFASTLATVQSSVDRFFIDAGEYPCIEQPTEDSPQPIDFEFSDASTGIPFIGGYLQFEPMTRAEDAGLPPGEIRYHVTRNGRVFATTSELADDTIAYTQNNVLGELTVSDIVAGALGVY